MGLRKTWLTVFIIVLTILLSAAAYSSTTAVKPSPGEALKLLKAGNDRFASGRAEHPHQDQARLLQAGSENQGDYAYATVISCSDSRVPVEEIFDAGVMDIFTIRVAGNVVDTDEAGSIEYGLAHVNTPVLVVLGHTQCGAVTAVAGQMEGHGHPLERNIPPLVDNIVPAVLRAMEIKPELHGDDLVARAIEENVWQGVRDLFLMSPATRRLTNEGRVKVVGAIYDVGTGRINWLPETKVVGILKEVESDPARAMVEMAEESDGNAAESTIQPSPDEVEARLARGNARYVAGSSMHPRQDASRREITTTQGQHPLATIMSCSDSRVPVEIIFDQGLGDIFAVRVAGNVCNVDEVGSIEYGVDHLNTPLMVVLGHTHCGAVSAVVSGAEVHGSIPSLLDSIVPAVEKARREHPDLSNEDLVAVAVKENVWQAIEDLLQSSPAVRDRCAKGRVKVVGAIYDLASGRVQWLGEHPDMARLLAN